MNSNSNPNQGPGAGANRPAAESAAQSRPVPRAPQHAGAPAPRPRPASGASGQPRPMPPRQPGQAGAPRPNASTPPSRHPAGAHMPQNGQPPRRAPLTPEQRMAREQARKRKKQQAQIRGAISLGALALVLILLVTSITKCAIGSGNPNGAETTDAPAVSGPLDSDAVTTSPETDAPSESESTPADTDPGFAPPTTNAPTTNAPVTDAPVIAPTVPFTLPESVESRYILFVNRTTGRIIYEKNADATAYPASITKIMTVLCAIENLSDTNASVTITQDLIDRLRARGAARAGFFAGEKVKATDLMYAALLPSGADGSVGLAELVSGSEAEFAKLMNKKAKELGMTNTNFVNATGLHENEHYSTCRDLYKLLDTALENELLRTLFTTDSYRTEPTNVHDIGIWMRSTMFRYLEEEGIERDYFLGGKTGYTGQAGVCLASLSKYDGNEYLLITLGAGNGDNQPRYQVHDAVAILDAYFAALG